MVYDPYGNRSPYSQQQGLYNRRPMSAPVPQPYGIQQGARTDPARVAQLNAQFEQNYGMAPTGRQYSPEQLAEMRRKKLEQDRANGVMAQAPQQPGTMQGVPGPEADYDNAALTSEIATGMFGPQMQPNQPKPIAPTGPQLPPGHGGITPVNANYTPMGAGPFQQAGGGMGLSNMQRNPFMANQPRTRQPMGYQNQSTAYYGR